MALDLTAACVSPTISRVVSTPSQSQDKAQQRRWGSLFLMGLLSGIIGLTVAALALNQFAESFEARQYAGRLWLWGRHFVYDGALFLTALAIARLGEMLWHRRPAAGSHHLAGVNLRTAAIVGPLIVEALLTTLLALPPPWVLSWRGAVVRLLTLVACTAWNLRFWRQRLGEQSAGS